MGQQLLWLEVLAKLGVGLVLLIAPRTVAKVLGLPPAGEPFWPRALGSVLIGIAAAAAIELHVQPGRALGLTGIVVVNLTMAAVLGGLLILGKASPTKRGRISIGLAAAALTLIALIGIVSAL